MAPNGLLEEFDDSALKHFKKDFIQMIKVGAEIDRYWEEYQHDLDIFIPKFEKLAEKFNRKYKWIKIKAKKTIEYYKVRIFIKPKDVREFFAEAAARIPGLKAVGKTNFSQVEVNDTDKFAKFLDSMLDKAYLSYVNPESGTSTFVAAFDRKERMIEIIASPADIINENSAAFKICAYYAMKGGFDKKIDIYGDASAFGFSNLLDEMEKREWFDRFNPRFLE
ncbi:hypothetical protein HY637_02445 [Candidatus Woesearchaeota archaeon]|nr:hypothetical protein [Candidatus Woesearchaeota archaeon]